MREPPPTHTQGQQELRGAEWPPGIEERGDHRDGKKAQGHLGMGLGLLQWGRWDVMMLFPW